MKLKKSTQIIMNFAKQLVPGEMLTAKHSSCLFPSLQGRNEFASVRWKLLRLVQDTQLF